MRRSHPGIGALVAALVVSLVSGAATAQATSGKHATRALFFGDSLFVGNGTSPIRPVQVQTASRQLQWAAAVDALGGTGYTTGGNGHLPYLSRLETDGFLDKHWDVIVLEGGTNDADHGWMPDLLAQARSAVGYLQERQPTARIVMVGAFAPEGPTPPAYIATDLILRQVAREHGLLYVSQVAYGATAGPGFYSDDHFHPNAAGYGVMGRDLATALAR